MTEVILVGQSVIVSFIVGIWLTLAICAYIMAERYRRFAGGWFILTLVWPPAILWLLAAGFRKEKVLSKTEAGAKSEPELTT